MIRIGLFIVGALAFGAVAIGVGWLIWGDEVLLPAGVAFGLTFIPAVGTTAWVLHTTRSAPELRLLAGMGGSGIRLFIGVGGAYFLTSAYAEHLRSEVLFGWLILFYLVFLGLEVGFLQQADRQLAETNPPPGQAPAVNPPAQETAITSANDKGVGGVG
jgi:hypothetical protein